jgi:RNA polymerase sigma-70 factor, ECF subfamily
MPFTLAAPCFTFRGGPVFIVRGFVLLLQMTPAPLSRVAAFGLRAGPVGRYRRIMTKGEDHQGQSGGEDRFETLYRMFGATIYARCRQMLGETAAAQDATQEVFLRVHRSLDKIRGSREGFAWLYRTATNHCLNEIRNGRLRPSLPGALPERVGPPAEGALLDHDLVARLVRKIPEDLALPAWLYHVDELDQAEIADICGVSRRTIISRLARFADAARTFIERSEHVGTP